MCRCLIDYLLIKRSKSFDAEYYLRQYQDIRRADINPLLHFFKLGWREGRNPSEDFNTNFYLRENLDVREATINPLIHYLKFGKAEGRLTNAIAKENRDPYFAWLQEYDTLSKTEHHLIRTQIATLSYQPLISIFILVHDPENELFFQTIDSILAQLYPNWELFFIAELHAQQKIGQLLKEKKYQDTRIISPQTGSDPQNGSALNSALTNCSGEFFGLVEQNDILREHALYLVVNKMNNFPHSEIIYSDNDWIDRCGKRSDPYFKPDWNPDLFYTHNYIQHFGVFRTDTAKQLGGFNTNYRGAEAWDLALLISEKISPENIGHIPFVLYHRRRVHKVAQPFLTDEERETIELENQILINHFSRLNRKIKTTRREDGFWRTEYLLPKHKPLVSIIIPIKNQPILLDNCLRSIDNKTDYPTYEIIIINNQSDEESTLSLLNSLKDKPNIHVLAYDHPFNYSAINNFAANTAQGEFLVFLNNDVEVISPNWLDEMIGNASRPEIGAVGAMLYYPGGTIQHAGLVLNPKHIALHVYHTAQKGFNGDNGRAKLTQNLSAVTAACMAIEKMKFEQVKGFDQTNLKIAYNDVDLCLRLMKAGYRNLWTPYAELFHHESASRGYEDTEEKNVRIQSEAGYMRQTWGNLLMEDPAYNPNLTIDLPDFSLAFPPRVEKPWTK